MSSVDLQRASWMFLRGDLEGAEKLRNSAVRSVPPKTPTTVKGQVVDDKGPVAGARVTAGTVLYGDSRLAAASFGADQRTVTTGSDGRFEIADAEAGSIVIAQHGDLRSLAIKAGDSMTVKLLPTSTVSGTIDLRGNPSTQVTLMVVAKGQPTENDYGLLAPIAPDGSFRIAGVPRGTMLLRTSIVMPTTQMMDAVEIAVTKPVVDGVHLKVKGNARPLEVLVRSTFGTPLTMANLILIAGKQPAEPRLSKLVRTDTNVTAKVALAPQPQQDRPTIEARKKPGDLYARFAVRPDGNLSLCASPMPDRLDDPGLQAARKDEKLLDKIPVKCIPVKPSDELVELAIPPWPRFD